MFVSKNSHIRAILLNIKKRKAGSMEKDGNTVKWDDAVQVVVILWEDTQGQPRKYTINPSVVSTIEKQLEPVYWGCVVELTLEDNQVTAVNIISDVMAELYVNESINL